MADARLVGGDCAPGALVVVRSRSSAVEERDEECARDGIGSEVRSLVGVHYVLGVGNVTMPKIRALAGERRWGRSVVLDGQSSAELDAMVLFA